MTMRPWRNHDPARCGARYSLSTTPYAGALFNGLAVQLVDNKPTRDPGWDQPVSGHVIHELVIPTGRRH